MMTDQIEPIHRRVALVIHSPTSGGRKLQKRFGWNDPDRLVAEFIEDLREVSYGIARYEVVERVEVDAFPVKADGFRYRPEQFEKTWKRGKGFHDPDLVDYPRLLDQFGIAQKVKARRIEEAWLMAFPYAGYYESIMAGPGAFWCNAPPLDYGHDVGTRFIVMGFNYERGVGEMLESYGHRAESILDRVFEQAAEHQNLWRRFIRHELSHPGQAQVGNIHFAPNSERDYDWGNRRMVMSACDDWYGFPELTGAQKPVNCEEWGNGDIRLHHRWWYRHLPHVAGGTGGVLNNWWAYILDPNLVD